MTFLNPIGLAGLLALPVILALHLFNRRRQPYPVSHLGLWSFVDARVHGPRARRLPLTWILLLDLLLAVLLSLAWAQPSLAIPQPGDAPRHVVILLDVSSSMRAREVFETRFAQGQAAAEALLREAAPRDVVTIVTFGERARVIADTRQGPVAVTGAGAQEAAAVDAASLAARLESVRAGETGYALVEALALGQSVLDPTIPAEFHVITDGAFPLQDPGAIERFAHPLRWHWIGQAAANQAVLELNATSLGNNQVEVFARLANFSPQPVTREVALSVDGQVVERAVIDLPGGASVPYVWQVSVGGGAGSVAVSLDGGAASADASADALAEDDSAAVGLQPGGQVRVALVAENPTPVLQALQAIPEVDVQVLAPADYTDGLPSVELTIFRGFLPTAWPAGQVLVLDPPAGATPVEGSPDAGVTENTTAQLSGGPGRSIPAASLPQADEASPLVAGIDFSGVRWGRAWSLSATPPGLVTVLSAGGAPLLLHGELPRAVRREVAGGNTPVAVLLADLTQGNFTRHPAYPILMANLVELARQAPLPLGFKTGRALPLPGQGSYRAIEITPPQGAPVTLSGSWPESWSDTLDPGLYHFTLTAPDGSQSEFSAGARAGDPVESDLTAREWARTIADPQNRALAEAELLDPARRMVDLSAWLLGAAALVFFLEAFLAWRR